MVTLQLGGREFVLALLLLLVIFLLWLRALHTTR